MAFFGNFRNNLTDIQLLSDYNKMKKYISVPEAALFTQTSREAFQSCPNTSTPYSTLNHF